jgi:hypothetical protein
MDCTQARKKTRQTYLAIAAMLAIALLASATLLIQQPRHLFIALHATLPLLLIVHWLMRESLGAIASSHSPRPGSESFIPDRHRSAYQALEPLLAMLLVAAGVLLAAYLFRETQALLYTLLESSGILDYLASHPLGFVISLIWLLALALSLSIAKQWKRFLKRCEEEMQVPEWHSESKC